MVVSGLLPTVSTRLQALIAFMDSFRNLDPLELSFDQERVTAVLRAAESGTNESDPGVEYHLAGWYWRDLENIDPIAGLARIQGEARVTGRMIDNAH